MLEDLQVGFNDLTGSLDVFSESSEGSFEQLTNLDAEANGSLFLSIYLSIHLYLSISLSVYVNIYLDLCIYLYPFLYLLKLTWKGTIGLTGALPTLSHLVKLVYLSVGDNALTGDLRDENEIHYSHVRCVLSLAESPESPELPYFML